MCVCVCVVVVVMEAGAKTAQLPVLHAVRRRLTASRALSIVGRWAYVVSYFRRCLRG